MARPVPANPIRPVGYRPRRDYGLDLEILTVSDLRRKMPPDVLKTPERIDFHMFIHVTAGHPTHLIDSEAFACEPGSFLTLRPGQVHRYDTDKDWNGWLVMFRPRFLLPDEALTPRNEREVFFQLDALPSRMQLSPTQREAVHETLSRMSEDGVMPALRADMHALLRVQLQSLLMRLYVLQRQSQLIGGSVSGPVRRFLDFREAVEKHHREFHGIQAYAEILGCSEKSLSRATQQMVGVSAKTYLMQHITLEAKRLLAHTGLQVSQISDRLGFDEPTNFSKFFKNFVGQTPKAFRDEKI